VAPSGHAWYILPVIVGSSRQGARVRRSTLAFPISSLFLACGCSLVLGDIPGPLHDAGRSASSGNDAAMDASPAQGGSPDRDAADSTTAMGDHPHDAADGQTSIGTDAAFDPCDRDGDGEQSVDCGGHDCDDTSRDVHTGQDQFFHDRNPTVGFDYNCNGQIEHKYPDPISCSVDSCDTQTQGYLDSPLPACGADGSWGHCVLQNIAGLPAPSCQAQIDETRPVACH